MEPISRASRAAVHLLGRSRGLLAVAALSAGSVFAVPARAWQEAQPPGQVAAYATGDAWLDGRLADIDAYAARYPQAFAAELERYAGIPREYTQAVRQQPGWGAGDAWLACFLARELEVSCRSLVRARARSRTAEVEGDWATVIDGIDGGPVARARVRLALADSYRRWARPLQPDAALDRALRQRAQERQRDADANRQAPPAG